MKSEKTTKKVISKSFSLTGCWRLKIKWDKIRNGHGLVKSGKFKRQEPQVRLSTASKNNILRHIVRFLMNLNCQHYFLCRNNHAFLQIFLTFFSTNPGGRACRYLHFPSTATGHDQNQPYLLFSNASKKYLQIWKKGKKKNWINWMWDM